MYRKLNHHFTVKEVSTDFNKYFISNEDLASLKGGNFYMEQTQLIEEDLGGRKRAFPRNIEKLLSLVL